MAEEIKPTEKTIEVGGYKITLKNVAQIVYICQALSFFFGITAVFGVVINYLKFNEVKGSWLESHFTWQMRTFWIGLGVGIVGGILTLVFVGFLVLIADLIWIVYRVVKGWLLLVDNHPIQDPAAFI